MLFTFLTMMTIVFERLAVIDWLKEKKDYENKPIHEIIYMIVEIILLIPTPNSIFAEGTWTTTDIQGNPVNISTEELLAAYVTIRAIYFLRFLIHF